MVPWATGGSLVPKVWVGYQWCQLDASDTCFVPACHLDARVLNRCQVCQLGARLLDGCQLGAKVPVGDLLGTTVTVVWHRCYSESGVSDECSGAI